MKTRATLAAAAVLLIVSVCFLVLRGHHIAPRSDADRSGIDASALPSNRRAPIAASTPALDASATPAANAFAGDTTKRVSLDMIAHDGAAAAQLWQAKAQKVIEAKYARDFGAENAALLRLPYDEAWRALDARAAAGDDNAFILATSIASGCQVESTYKAKPPTPAFYEGLPDDWVPFVERLRAMGQDAHDRRVSHCAGIDLKTPMNSFFDVLDRFMRPDNPDARVAIASENTNDAEAIADLRQVAKETGNLQARLGLGDRLLQSIDPSQQKEGLALLEQMADEEPFVTMRLAYCLQSGCGHFPADPPAARVWVERAAGSGDEIGVGMLLGVLDTEGNTVDAWAWSRYELDLAMAGCLETIVPTYLHIRAAARDEARRRHALSAAQQNAGLAVYYEISGRWQHEAMERLACAD